MIIINNILKFSLKYPFSYLLILIFMISSGCTRYATKEELIELDKIKQDVYALEKEVKELKERQIELINLRSKILKEIDKCKKLRKFQGSE